MRRILVVLCALTATACRHAQQTERPSAPEFFRADPATAGSIRGTVLFAGRRPPAQKISMEAEEACMKLHGRPVSVEAIATGTGGGLSGTFVYIETGLEGKNFEPPRQAVVLDQRGCLYVPRVVALQAGQTLHVKNSDPVSHNIHPVPQNNREWNQQQPPGAPDLVRRFARPEIVIPVKCNVHAWMKSYIGVVGHPFFAVTAEDGRFAWDGVPPGEYTVAVWHETLGDKTEKIVVPQSGSATLTVTFKRPA